MKSDSLWRGYLTVSRDVYHRHPFELSATELERCTDFIALAVLENDEAKASSR